MSSVILPEVPPSVDPDVDPDNLSMVHGWRWVWRRMYDGQPKLIQIPLTARDVLHPKLGDEIMHADAHQRTCRYLGYVFEARVESDPSAIVLTDTGVDLGLEDVKPISPDIGVIFKIRARKNWKVFDVKAEGTKPSLIIEITSSDRRTNDTVDKFDYYFRARIPVYVIIDLAKPDKNGVPPLYGYEWAKKGYKELKADSRGRLWLDAVGVWLEGRKMSVVCYDGKTGEEIRGLAAQLQAREEAEQRARKEERARRAAEDRLKQLEAEVAKLRGDKRP